MIALLIPGIILGTLIKGLTYLHKPIRENHRLIILSKTPIERMDIGSEEEGVNLDQLLDQVNNKIKENRLHRSVKAIVVYTTAFLNTIGSECRILDLNPQKIILVGLRIIHNSRGFDKSFMEMGGWEMREEREGYSQYDTLIVQNMVGNVEEALADKPPRKSWFSEPLKRVYVVRDESEVEAQPSDESF